MSFYEVVPATDEHYIELAENMRQVDRDEIWAANAHGPIQALSRAKLGSRDPKTGLAGGRVLCCFGVAPVTAMSNRGIPWMLATDLLEQHAVAFGRYCIPVVKELVEPYRFLVNYVDARNVAAIRWLRWMGFHVEEPAPFGPFGQPFHRFTLGDEENV